MKKNWYFRLIFSFIILTSSYSDSVNITQINNSALLLNQAVEVYTSVTDNRGVPVPSLTVENFSVYESSADYPEVEREIIDFKQGINMLDGINLLLVIDNSGSMYWNADGTVQDSADESVWRITYAKNAIKSLIDKIKNPKDRIAFLSFNASIGSVVELTKDNVRIEQAVGAVSKPGEGQGFTELFETLYASASYLENTGGRKIIILLSDGEDYPKEDNPAFPERHGLDGAIEILQKVNISVFTIGLSSGADKKVLERIANETGGASYSVYNPEEISELYSLIRNQVLNEYLITFRAGTEPAEMKNVRIEYVNGSASAGALRDYYSSTMFGIPQDELNWLIFLAIPLAILLFFLLSLIKFDKSVAAPTLDLLTVDGKKKKQTFTIVEGKSQITIGGTRSSDMTIMGDPKLTAVEATIVKKPSGEFTIAGDGIKVNNRTVKTRVLKSGDLITVGATTIVFDSGDNS